MSVLSRQQIVEAMERPDLDRRLVITPLVSPEESLDSVSVNVRLGNEFIVMRKQSFPLLDIADREELSSRIETYQEKLVVDYGRQFVLHPNQLVLGSTLEYISLPRDLMSYVVGKSSWGRMGLVIATATKVDPCFKGCITLEIINEGEAPLVLYPGVPIAQLVFHQTASTPGYEGGYGYATGPRFPDFSRNHPRWKFWFSL